MNLLLKLARFICNTNEKEKYSREHLGFNEWYYSCIECNSEMRKDYFYMGANNAFFCKNQKCSRYEIASPKYRDIRTSEIDFCIK